MAEITFDEWMDLSKKRFRKRSEELKKVDASVNAFEKATTPGVKAQKLQDLARDFQLWAKLKTSGYTESIRNRKLDDEGQGPAERLQTLIRTHQLSNVAIVRDLEADVPDRLVLDVSLKNLKDSSKVRETDNRANLAVHAARDSLLKAVTGGTAGRTLYERWFGTYDATRYSDVKANFRGLCDLFDKGVIIVHDARQLTNGW